MTTLDLDRYLVISREVETELNFNPSCAWPINDQTTTLWNLVRDITHARQRLENRLDATIDIANVRKGLKFMTDNKDSMELFASALAPAVKQLRLLKEMQGYARHQSR